MGDDGSLNYEDDLQAIAHLVWLGVDRVCLATASRPVCGGWH